MPLSDKQKRFIELELRKEEIKKYHEDFNKALFELIAEQGLNSYFMDEAGTVYKLVPCTGKYIPFEQYTYCRTRRAGEERGSLSMKEAKEMGFNVS